MVTCHVYAGQSFVRRMVIRALAGPATPDDDAVGGTGVSKLVINDVAPVPVC